MSHVCTSFSNKHYLPCLLVAQIVMRLIRQGVDATLRNPMTAYHDRVRLLNYGYVT